MRFGLYLPTEGDFADVRLLARLAHEAEEAGWDGFFIWDELLPIYEHSDPVRNALGQSGNVVDAFADSKNRAPRRRAARWDGFVPASDSWPDGVISVAEYEGIVADITDLRPRLHPFEVVLIGNATGTLPTTDSPPAYAAAGVTWVLAQALSVDEARSRICNGPPTLPA